MISDENLSRSEKEAILHSSLLSADDWMWKLQKLHNLFKYTSLGLMQDVSSEKNALENLDTLLDIFLNENESYLSELDSLLKKSRELMKSIRSSQELKEQIKHK